MLEYVWNVLKLAGKLCMEVITTIAEPFDSNTNEENGRKEEE